MENKIKINKTNIINNLIKRESIEQTRQQIAIYLNLTGIYLKVNKKNKNLLKINLADNCGGNITTLKDILINCFILE